MSELVYKTLRQEVADAIRHKILDGELKPGERIVEQDMAADLGVSRGPVREALREIEQDGLIEYARNIGCSVKRVTDEDIYEIYLLRATYEIMAVKLCKGQLSAQSLREMERALSSMEHMRPEDFDVSIDYDNQFHGSIIQQTGLPRLRRLWTSLNPGNVVTYYVGSTDHAAAVSRQFAIHRDVFEAYQTRDPKIISAKLMEHYMLTIKRRLAEKGTPPSEFNYEMDLEL